MVQSLIASMGSACKVLADDIRPCSCCQGRWRIDSRHEPQERAARISASQHTHRHSLLLCSEWLEAAFSITY